VTLLYPELRARGASLDKSLLADVRERITKLLMEQVITTRGKFYADEGVWAEIGMVTRKFLHSSLSMNFCIPPHCP
jgi:hypothetical protein